MSRRTKHAAPEEPDDLAGLLMRLNLTVASARVEELLRQAQEKSLSYSAFLAALLNTECAGRFDRKLSRGLKRSRLGAAKNLEEFDFSIRPKLSPAAVKELLSCRWVSEGRSILCVGRPGTGKTHVAKALGHAACMKGYSVLYVNTADLLDELHASLADNTYSRLFRRYSRVDVLIADELGYLPLDRKKSDYLFRLVSARHPERSMIVTANTGFKGWERFFPSKAQAIATIDRLIDRATILRFTGKGCREPKDIHGGALEGDE
jgi:DNA replication protein DnaC